MSKPLVQVSDLRVVVRGADGPVTILHGVDFSLEAGKVLCVLGESGSGKSMTMRALMRLVPRSATISGRVLIDGVDVLALRERELARIRGSLVAMIFQEPATALDPTFTIGHQIAETVRAHEGASWADARRRALDLLELVQVPSAARRLQAYPHELSGGLRQRAMIALALSCRPKVLIADEPTTALDATVQIQVLLLLRELQRELGMATLFVTHDVGVACEIADEVAVMYAGRIVERGSTEEVLGRAGHPYARGLLRSVVTSDLVGTRLVPIDGSPPELSALPPGCSFAPRCNHAIERCSAAVPELAALSASHRVRCARLGELEPAIPHAQEVST
ncbi:ABC transporter ATP-binding protein [Salinarimonas ramus]|uniref:ABC transporter ATP-binding protein n=1 Tax=Salinarimonas ramus TaxID=690164 RepID=A0A917Q417_9HYPH|nr:ABC transporter ATP-binding protein [Salinarimonas ramus]GGK20793.1 ABC transporter ATP-binding protein [Salinarimonas ramus]